MAHLADTERHSRLRPVPLDDPALELRRLGRDAKEDAGSERQLMEQLVHCSRVGGPRQELLLAQTCCVVTLRLELQTSVSHMYSSSTLSVHARRQKTHKTHQAAQSDVRA